MKVLVSLALVAASLATAPPSYTVSSYAGPAGPCDSTIAGGRSSEYVNLWITEPLPTYPDHTDTWGVWPVGSDSPPRVYEGTISFPYHGGMGQDIRVGVPGSETPCSISPGDPTAPSMVTCMIPPRYSGSVFEVQGVELPITMKALDLFPQFTATVDMGPELGRQFVNMTFGGGCVSSYTAPSGPSQPMISTRGSQPSQLKTCGVVAEVVFPLVASAINSQRHPEAANFGGTLKMMIGKPAEVGPMDTFTAHRIIPGAVPQQVDCTMDPMSVWCDITPLFMDAAGLLVLPQVTDLPATVIVKWHGARAPWMAMAEFMNYPTPGAPPMFVGSGYGTAGCKFPAGSCEPATPSQTWGYTTDCNEKAIPGSTCQATGCAAPRSGAPVNPVYTCTDGVWVGSPRGCEEVMASPTQNVPACPYKAFHRYAEVCQAAYEGTVCSVQTCAAGFVGTASGSWTCTNGMWEGADPTGCAPPPPPPPPGTCYDPPFVRGYTTNCTAVESLHGTVCDLVGCDAAAGYSGMPVSNFARCESGMWKLPTPARGCEVFPAGVPTQMKHACPMKMWPGYTHTCEASYEGSVCTFSGACAAGYSMQLGGSVSGSFTCIGSWWEGPGPSGCFEGQAPLPAGACERGPAVMGYTTNCSMTEAYLNGAVCGVVGCKEGAGYYGAPLASTMQCHNSKWVATSPIRGCEPMPGVAFPTPPPAVPACPTMSFSGYAETCAAAFDGDSCVISSCAVDYSADGSVTAVGGNLMCKNSYWVGEPKGCSVGLPPVTCGELARPAYDHTCVGDVHHGQHCRPTQCSAGHVLAAGAAGVTGDLVCQNGQWNGVEFGGCVEDVVVMPRFGTCGALTPELPVGYMTTNCTGAAYDTYSTCEVMCDGAAGYSGIAMGSSMCFDGKWYSQYGGCEKKCRLPESMCDHTTGALMNGVSVRGLFGEQSVDGGCWLDSRGKFSLWRASCGRGYHLSSTSNPAAQSATFCLGGTLVGGFAKYDPPTCVAEGTEVKKQCKCGDPGKHSLTTQAVSGLFRTGASVPGKNEWRCDRVQNFVTCRCEC